MSNLTILAKISQIEVESGKFSGVLSAEQLDRHGEVMDYEKSKPYFVSYFERHSKASNGKSVGALRAMHQKTVIGVLTKSHFNDALKQIEVEGEVLDPIHKELLIRGGYTGLSVGGLKKTFRSSNGEQRFIAMPSESSLVDTPAVPGAIIMLKYADGHIEEISAEVKQQENTDILLKGLGAVQDLASALRALGWVIPDSEENKSKMLQIRKKAYKLLLDLVKESFSELQAEHADPVEGYETSFNPEKGEIEMANEPKNGDNVETISIEKLQKDLEGKLNELNTTNLEKIETLQKSVDNFNEVLTKLNDVVSSIVSGFDALVKKSTPSAQDTAVRTLTKSSDSSYDNPTKDSKEEVVKESKLEKSNDLDLALAAMKNLKPLNAKVE